ncbi:MAG TPA: MFS transporter [Acidimicrobiia bacterium]|nr:MFS transporter [Acidimicrobiia bacterium]
MATETEQRVVQIAAVAQGVALVTFPAASTIFTNADDYDLSRSAYGAMFVPQAVTAVAASVLGASWAARVGTRKIYLIGLTANVVAMALLVVSATVQHDESIAYPILLLATGCLGVGFGFTVPALNTFTAAFNPAKVDASVLVLNALLGVGTALAPVLVAVFVGLDLWWGLPALTGIVLVGLLVASSRLAFAVDSSARPPEATARRSIPVRFWIYAGFALCYGICETMNGNWASLDMKDLGASTTQASLALTTFWASVTLGRVVFAALQRWVPTSLIYRALPVLLVAVFLAISQLPDDEPALAIVTFGLAGLGCSALLPLTISFGQGELTAMSAGVAGGVIASYQVGYGIAAFGAGPLQSAGVDLAALFAWSAVVAAVMAALALVLTRSRADGLADLGARRELPSTRGRRTLN